jgi:hydroxyacylglutathione hydrolase
VSRAVFPPPDLRWVDAGNAGPFTLEGTRTHIVGRRRVAVVDPGPALDTHVEAVAAEVERERPLSVVLLLTHGHADHAGAAPALASRLGADVVGAWGEAEAGEGAAATSPPAGLGFRALRDGEGVQTDAGDLLAVRTPGHAREHVSFHWPGPRAVFVGDLLLGTGETTWVGAYPGCVADYLASLDRVESLAPRLLLPAHGGPVLDPAPHIARYRAHRRARIAQVAHALAERPDATADDLVATVYGDTLPPALADAARASVAVLIAHVRRGQS